LAQAAKDGLISDHCDYCQLHALSGFALFGGNFVGGTIALIPSRRRDISDLGWKALFVSGTLATLMIACIAVCLTTVASYFWEERRKRPQSQFRIKPAVYKFT
jgi:nucleoside permease NupC